MTIEIPIGQVKRDISELVNRVAYQGERIILTSRGKPKAVLVSLQDYSRIQESDTGVAGRSAWLVGAAALAAGIRQRRGGQDLDVDNLLAETRADLEARVVANDLVILDASLVVKAILPNPQLEACQALIAALGTAQLISPALWLYEVSSAFVKSVHFGQLTSDEAQAAIRQALALGVELIPPDETQSLLAMRWAQKLTRFCL